jgi:hypothetical protein
MKLVQSMCGSSRRPCSSRLLAPLRTSNSNEVLSERLAEPIESRHVLRETAVFFPPAACPLRLLCHILKAIVLFPHLGRIKSERISLIFR